LAFPNFFDLPSLSTHRLRRARQAQHRLHLPADMVTDDVFCGA
jgi:hypothetical protein